MANPAPFSHLWPEAHQLNVSSISEARISTANTLEDFDSNSRLKIHTNLSNNEKGRRKSVRSTDSDNTIAVNPETFDFEKTIRAVLRKKEKHGIISRELGVAFRDLHVTGLGASTSYQPTLGSLFSPTAVLDGIRNIRHPPLRDILLGFEGLVKPGEMILVLGSPGAGCSTLLKTIANQREDYHSVDGEVHYDSITPHDLKKYFRGDVQYCPEDDVHFPTLTVEQTIQFAATTRTPRNCGDHSRAEFSDKVADILATVLGLRDVRTTAVGDAAIRGVSGGQKKRVSIAEALAIRASIACWDNSTRGLDASTALEFVQTLRILTDTLRMATVASLYQAGESLYHHFDKVCVIYEGRMTYFGPASKAKEYFLEMGYEPANRQTTPDFLVAVTDPAARIPRVGFHNQPRNADEFARYFKESKLGKENAGSVNQYIEKCTNDPARATAYIESARAEFSKNSGNGNPYVLTIPQQVAAVMKRKVQIIRGNALATGLNLFSYIFQALIIGSVFVNLPVATSAFFSRGGVLFFALLFAALASMAEIPALFAQRSIVARHEKSALYHPFIETLAHTLVDIPVTLFITSVFTVILYFMAGLQRSAGQFFIFFLYLIVISITMKSWFRAIASAFKSQASAQAFAGISILALAIYTGYTIPKPTMIGALRWITYINPLRYGFEAILTNEYRTLNATCSSLVPRGAGYENVSLSNQVCAVVGAQSGQDFVDGNVFAKLSYGFAFSNIWKNFGIVVAFCVGFTVALLIFAEYVTSTSSETTRTLFKRSSIRNSRPTTTQDEEVGAITSLSGGEEKHAVQAAANEQPLVHTDIFTWQNVVYTVPIPGGQDKKLLSNVSGYVAPGKLTALMGESGAGKTMLLNVLAKRADIGVVAGEMLVNGHELPADFQSQTGYCQQNDTHAPGDTVREALLFSAKLRQPSSVSVGEKAAYVEKCIQLCGLEDYAEATIGSLNIEYKKRTTIAVELAARPKLLLFLDEPTSGLDSQSAWAIVSFLRSLADQGQAILCTIHQPSAELFQVFDRILLLKKGGETVYFGDIGDRATTLLNYFENQGARKCEPHENPAEYMLDVIGAGATATSTLDWHALWNTSATSTAAQEEINTIIRDSRADRSAATQELHTEFATSWIVQVKELFVREARGYWRNPTYLMAKLVLNVLSGLFIGFTFFKSKDTQQGTQNKLFAIFMVTILSVPSASQLMVPFINTRNIYEIRERPSRMYSWTALLLSQIMIEVPWNILCSTLLYFTWYWTVGFDNSRAGYTYLMIGVIFPTYYTTIGQAVASMSPNAEIGALLFSVLFSFVITFNGVLQPFSQLGWWKWMYRLSPYTYLIEGLLGQAIGNQQITCAPIEYVTINPPSGMTCGEYMGPYIARAEGYLTNAAEAARCHFCSTRTTNEFLELNFSVYYGHRWRNVGFMFAFILFNIFSIYVLTYLFRIRTGSVIPSFRKAKKP